MAIVGASPTTLIVLGALTVGCGVGALRLYPEAEVLTRADPIMVSVVSDREIDAVEMGISPVGLDHSKWEVDVGVFSPSDEVGGAGAQVFVVIPNDVGLNVICDTEIPCQKEFEPGMGPTLMRTRVMSQPGWEAASDGGTSVRTRLIWLHNSVPSIECTTRECKGTVPVVGVGGETPVAAAASVHVEIAASGLTDYDWNSDVASTASAQPYLRFGYPLRDEREAALSPRFTVDGVNQRVLDSDSRVTFIAGALIGVAGGALIGLMQELFQLVRDRRRATG